jgi:methylated-DNA-protein-cysteine methyltransferase related protein
VSVYSKVYDIVMQIPRGRVLTYGVVSKMMGGRLSPLAVGWALKALPEDASKTKDGSLYHSKSVPWHRVLNSRGTVSTRSEPGMVPDLQQRLLEAEGVSFDFEGKIDLPKYLWKAKAK